MIQRRKLPCALEFFMIVQAAKRIANVRVNE